MKDLTIALWCALVIGATAGSHDVTCLMADPVAAEDAFGELLAWSATDQRPERYNQYAGQGPLLHPTDLDRIAESIRRLGRERGLGAERAA